MRTCTYSLPASSEVTPSFVGAIHELPLPSPVFHSTFSVKRDLCHASRHTRVPL